MFIPETDYENGMYLSLQVGRGGGRRWCCMYITRCVSDATEGARYCNLRQHEPSPSATTCRVLLIRDAAVSLVLLCPSIILMVVVACGCAACVRKSRWRSFTFRVRHSARSYVDFWLVGPFGNTGVLPKNVRGVSVKGVVTDRSNCVTRDWLVG